MKRGRVFVVLLCVILLSISFASAGWFSDLFKKEKITGNYVTITGEGIKEVGEGCEMATDCISGICVNSECSSDCPPGSNCVDGGGYDGVCCDGECKSSCDEEVIRTSTSTSTDVSTTTTTEGRTRDGEVISTRDDIEPYTGTDSRSSTGRGSAPDTTPSSVCGDGKREEGEECDDGQLFNLAVDGCDANCKIVDGWVCDGALGQTSNCHRDPSKCDIYASWGTDSSSDPIVSAGESVNIRISGSCFGNRMNINIYEDSGTFIDSFNEVFPIGFQAYVDRSWTVKLPSTINSNEEGYLEYVFKVYIDDYKKIDIGDTDVLSVEYNSQLTGVCGNGKLDNPNEECDDDVFEYGIQCNSYDDYWWSSDYVSCDEDNCKIDFSGCTCGNGKVDSGEECDGSNLKNENCLTYTGVYTGDLKCTDSCKFDTSNCKVSTTPPQNCEITNVYWSQSSITLGDTVNLNVFGSSGCTYKEFDLEIYDQSMDSSFHVSIPVELYLQDKYEELSYTYSWKPSSTGQYAFHVGEIYSGSLLVNPKPECYNKQSEFQDCTSSIANAKKAERERVCYNNEWGDYGTCYVKECEYGYEKSGNVCVCIPNWQTGSWSTCSSSGTQSRTVTDSNDCGVNTGKPATSQSCTPPCIPNWQVSSWNPCSSSGTQSRTVTDSNDCGTTDGKPISTQSCTPTCTPNWQIGSWSTCSSSGTQSRTVTDSNDCGVNTGKPATSQSCNPPCIPNWQIGSWSSCSNGQQTRTVTDSNDCGVNTDRPISTQSCTPTCTPNWQTGSWSSCSNGQQTRTVTDSNDCGVNSGKPSTSQSCDCNSPQTTCDDDKNYYLCSNNKWVSQGKIDGECGYTEEPPTPECTQNIVAVSSINGGEKSCTQYCDNGQWGDTICTINCYTTNEISPDGQYCVPKTTPQTCTSDKVTNPVINGGTKTCVRKCNNGVWSSNSVCTITCNSENYQFNEDLQSCVLKTTQGCVPGQTEEDSCSVTNGYGGKQTRTCSSLGKWGGWSACVPGGCNDGYEKVGNSCVLETLGGTDCGDGIREGNEACEVGDLNGKTCQDFGYGYGNLGCNSNDCTFNFDNCVYSCEDSDNGIDLYEKGKLTINGHDYFDECSPESQKGVYEYFCRESGTLTNPSNLYKKNLEYCTGEGEVCLDGKCVVPEEEPVTLCISDENCTSSQICFNEECILVEDSFCEEDICYLKKENTGIIPFEYGYGIYQFSLINSSEDSAFLWIKQVRSREGISSEKVGSGEIYLGATRHVNGLAVKMLDSREEFLKVQTVQFSCLNGESCPGDYNCFAGICSEESLNCLNNLDCGFNNKICVDKQCTNIDSCIVNEDCPGKEICLDNLCVYPRLCGADDDCPGKQKCDSGICRYPELCDSNSDCNSLGEECKFGFCVEKVSCELDTDCLETQTCEDSYCEDIECMFDWECPPGEQVCREGICMVPSICAFDSDCLLNEYCSDGYCKIRLEEEVGDTCSMLPMQDKKCIYEGVEYLVQRRVGCDFSITYLGTTQELELNSFAQETLINNIVIKRDATPCASNVIVLKFQEAEEELEPECYEDPDCFFGEICVMGECIEEEEWEEQLEIYCEFGCALENYCYPIGYRIDTNYCSINGEFIPQFEEGEVCNNHFECGSNLCINGECVSQGLLQKIIDFFKELFSSDGY